jgi:hypothetical protein
MRDPETVAGIVSALRQVHGDGVARLLLNDGLSLAALIDALLRAPLRNSDAVKLIKGALSSGDFIVTPDVSFSSPPSSFVLVTGLNRRAADAYAIFDLSNGYVRPHHASARNSRCGP